MNDDTSTSYASEPPIDIADVIAQLAGQQARFVAHIDGGWDDLDAGRLARLLTLYGQNATRLGRLLRDRAAIYGPPPDPLQVLIDEALEHFWREVDAQNAARESSTPDSPTR